MDCIGRHMLVKTHHIVVNIMPYIFWVSRAENLTRHVAQAFFSLSSLELCVWVYHFPFVNYEHECQNYVYANGYLAIF